LVVVGQLDAIVEDLKSLPPGRLRIAADFIQRLRQGCPEERQALLAETFGRLSVEEAAELERIIEGGCANVNEHGW
jgi:hypothetical protein